ncbi:MAG: ECF-type sigma factor [Vicinamibacterales bacterium]
MSSIELTGLLHRAQQGDASAAEAFFEESYPLLRQLARARLRGHLRTPTLDTGSLVQEAYLRFANAGRLQLADSLHFRRWAAKVMRSVIVDIARRRGAERRGGRLARLTLATDLPVSVPDDADLIVRVHEALDELAQVDPRAAQVVELRYFAGMTEQEVAGALGVTDRTVRRDWEKARLMLGQMLRPR